MGEIPGQSEVLSPLERRNEPFCCECDETRPGSRAMQLDISDDRQADGLKGSNCSVSKEN